MVNELRKMRGKLKTAGHTKGTAGTLFMVPFANAVAGTSLSRNQRRHMIKLKLKTFFNRELQIGRDTQMFGDTCFLPPSCRTGNNLRFPETKKGTSMRTTASSRLSD